ncbi:hypothetical protein NIES2135_27010 [Leptolyngbya boryana NIES-2135]|jgi:hypothetical protein|uniref:Uncharacterized protein n=1 Tax=Leptolyngbya boryana NIES-2135 TaxID=1973484 RepID=A0A1Z4JGJ9_LEPBY|nr:MULTISPECIES: hypothetical protein [Leptolyngbya]BAY55876.1 hypothetical protein NIES2135_27010 [Leptolyngbya boryana NIES-2135]MBD2368818.1 hypothetical protein [Leptolyngbya sp. FACHB-161]MBD2375314.1 hypothetical protein [Leptolyngbya sp. FACHB-238]MBD2399732.1 hypothetical protein [Leptolyngbya sp. FACHB-239]MBD2405938.1 hypothetical protein [Leptolyngbya sp. FACHB-402]
MNSNLDIFGDEWLREAARIEEEAGGDIGAGFDWGTGLGAYVASSKSFIDRDKVMTVLQETLTWLDQEELEAMINSLEDQARNHWIEKFQAAQSA